MSQSEQINELAKALSAVQGELQDVERDRQGRGYKYADLGAVLAEVRPLLCKHGLSVVQMPGMMTDGVMSLETTLLHESGQWMSSRCSAPVEQALNSSGKPITSMVQCVGSVITYLRRYSLAACLGVTQVDADGSYAEHAPAARQEPAPTRPSLPPRPEPVANPNAISKDQASRIWEVAKRLWPAAPKDGVQNWLRLNGFPSVSSDLTAVQADKVCIMLEEAVSM
jgi:hypothetical protein